MVYSDAHRAFLQILLQHRILSSIKVEEILGKIFSHFELNADSITVDQFITDINNELEELHMVIRRTIQEKDEEDVRSFVLINNLNNEATQSCSSFTKAELGYLKKLIEIIIKSDGGVIREMTALTIDPSPSAKLSASVAENLMEKLVEERWLQQEKGKISLSALTVSELRLYIAQNFEDEGLKCYFCKEYTLKGYSCPECQTRGHRSCLTKYWDRTKNKGRKCPVKDCSAVFDISGPAASKRKRILETHNSSHSDED